MQNGIHIRCKKTIWCLVVRMHTDTLRRRNSNLLRTIQLCFLFTFKSLFFKAFFTAMVSRSLLRDY